MFFVRKFRIMNCIELSCLFLKEYRSFFLWHVPQFVFVWCVFWLKSGCMSEIPQEWCVLCNSSHWEGKHMLSFWLIASYVNFYHNPWMRVGSNSFLHHKSPFPLFCGKVFWDITNTSWLSKFHFFLYPLMIFVWIDYCVDCKILTFKEFHQSFTIFKLAFFCEEQLLLFYLY